jgi:hypothetical protein
MSVWHSLWFARTWSWILSFSFKRTSHVFHSVMHTINKEFTFTITHRKVRSWHILWYFPYRIYRTTFVSIFYFPFLHQRVPTGGQLVAPAGSVSWVDSTKSSYTYTYIYIYCNKLAGFYIQDGSLLHSQFNTLQLITVHNSSRPLTQV